MKYYVSVTGLTLKTNLSYPRFMYHAVPSFTQARKAEGNVFAETRSIKGCHHTLTVWEDKKSMRKYMYSGAHIQAMKVTKEIADLSNTKTYGYESDHVPTWQEAIEQWGKHATLYGKSTANTDENKGAGTPQETAATVH
ncbi:unnamed protein product [Cylindrotheca closterium]|uniref:DUF3291 domain-containing protein n=1 Tax=Cylindrotheca closterium TaxID=2856 RepID=A0AAD2PU64_9STRA|nr:unnamed protein product [Cylindrotheca closterium]